MDTLKQCRALKTALDFAQNHGIISIDEHACVLIEVHSLVANAADNEDKFANLQGRLDAAEDYIAEHKRKIERIKKLMGEQP